MKEQAYAARPIGRGLGLGELRTPSTKAAQFAGEIGVFDRTSARVAGRPKLHSIEWWERKVRRSENADGDRAGHHAENEERHTETAVPDGVRDGRTNDVS